MCATSIGLTFSHIPVPGERKSGIPDGTDTPAPVKTTAERASRSISARRVVWLARVRVVISLRAPDFGAPRPAASWARRPWLLALELRRPLAEEGADALLGVLRVERGLEPPRLGLETLAELAGRRHRLDLLDRDRRLLRELARPRERGVEQLVVRHHGVDEPEPLGLIRADRVAEQVQLERLALADEPRQALRAAEARDDPEVYLRLAERRRLRGDAEVACH